MRCVAADSTLLASGSSDHAIRVWRASSSSDASSDPSGIGSSRGSSSGGSHPSSRDSSFLPFDLAGDRAVLEGHAGPVSCLQLTPSLIVSGSWDCSVRLWDRATLDCVGMVHTGKLAGWRCYSGCGCGAGSARKQARGLSLYSPFSNRRDAQQTAAMSAAPGSLRMQRACLLTLHAGAAHPIHFSADDWVSSLAVKGGLLAAACGTTVQLFRWVSRGG